MNISSYGFRTKDLELEILDKSLHFVANVIKYSPSTSQAARELEDAKMENNNLKPAAVISSKV